MKTKELFDYLVAQISVYDKQEAREIVFCLLEHLHGLKKIDILSNNDVSVESDWEALLFRINTHEPIQYILGETIFLGNHIGVNPAVLIPRPETEELVTIVLKNLPKQPLDLLDIGTGSGCIAIALAKRMPQWRVSAWDISDKALAVAQKNTLLNNVAVHFEKNDILNLSPCILDRSWDVIVSNPPYVKQKEMTTMHKNVLAYEPHLALFVADATPLIFYEAIANYAQQTLKPLGYVFLEINETLGEETANVFKTRGFRSVKIQKDINQKDRFVWVQI